MAMSILFQRKEEGWCTGSLLSSQVSGEMAPINRDFFGKSSKGELHGYFGTMCIYLTKRFTISLIGLFSMEYFDVFKPSSKPLSDFSSGFSAIQD